MPNFTKTDISAVLKDTKEILKRQLILTVYKSRKSDQLSVSHGYVASTIPTLTILGVGVITVYYKCKKNKCKKRTCQDVEVSEKKR